MKKKKEFVDDFGYFEETKTKEKHIQLDLNILGNREERKREVKAAPNNSSPFEDLLNFDSNLIDIKEKKEDGNLIDFSNSNNRQMLKPGQRFYPQHNFHQQHSMGKRHVPVQAIHHPGMYNHVPIHAPHPMSGFNTRSMTGGPRLRASVPRKPSADLIDKPQSSNIPKKKKMATEDFFNFN